MTELLVFTNVLLVGCFVIVWREASKLNTQLKFLKGYSIAVTKFASEACGTSPQESSQKFADFMAKQRS